MIRRLSVFCLSVLMCFSGVPLHSGVHEVTVSSYTTSVANQDTDVRANIALAASKLNDVVILPGSTFSFNSTVGEASAANGYRPGRVLYADTVAYEPGGGVCQVSSTLFNALLLAGCTIIERHRHNQPVRYVEPGLDATIRYGKKDLRMKNPHDFPLYIYTEINDSSLNMIIRAVKNPQQAYEVFTEVEEVNLPFNNEEGRKIRPGLTIYVYRKRTVNGVAESVLLYKDFFPPAYVE
ncbi:MAG TPA: VanW family protein [Spirochaetota bacterium]|nr:VanW family protein [Spirochaetota bacterium]